MKESLPSRFVDALNWLLNLSSEVRREESVTVLLFLTNLFLVLVAYYIIKTVREPLILSSGGGAELKSYAAATQAGVLLVYLPIYGWVSQRTSRMWLNAGIVVFFVACIQAFFLAGYWAWPNVFSLLGSQGVVGWASRNITLGFVFYIWVGIFSLSTIAQFWSYANDLYDESTGKRLFPVIAIGATLGAPLGSLVAARLFDAGISPFAMLQISALLLLVHLVIYLFIEQRYCRNRAHREQSDEVYREAEEECVDEQEGGFRLILQSRYLQWLALFFIFLNLVNTTGEYLLSVFVKDAAEAAVAAGQVEEVGAYIGQFYGDFFSVVNVVTVIVQTFLVARLLKWFGMKGVIFALPIVSFGTYGLVAAGVGLPIYRWAKTAENSTDYSVMNTTRALVWLPTTKSEKYAAKQTVDTFFVRFGDVLSAGLVFVGTGWLSFGPRQFAVTNLVLIGLWIGVGLMVLRHFWRRSDQQDVSMEDLVEEAGQ